MTHDFSISNEKVDGVDMVRIRVGASELLLTIGEAYDFAEAVTTAADDPAFSEHLDGVFDAWGAGGDCTG